MDLFDNQKIVRLLRLLLAGITFISLFFILLRPIIDSDFFWHLATGRWIVEHRTLPESDPFNYTTPAVISSREHFILTSYWLCQILYYGIYYVSGWNGFIISRFVILGAIIYFIYKRAGDSDSIIFFSLMTIAMIVFARMYPLERPQVFSFLFFAILLYLLDEMKRNSRAEDQQSSSVTERQSDRATVASADSPIHRFTYCSLPLLMLIWANMHPGFIVGQGVIVIYLLTEGLKFFYPSLGPMAKSSYIKFLVSGTAGILVALVNPAGYSAIVEMWHVSELPSMTGNVDHLSTTISFKEFYTPDMPVYWLLLTTAIVVLFYGIIRKTVTNKTISKAPSPSPSPTRGEGNNIAPPLLRGDILHVSPPLLRGDILHVSPPLLRGDILHVSPPLRGGDKGEGDLCGFIYELLSNIRNIIFLVGLGYFSFTQLRYIAFFLVWAIPFISGSLTEAIRTSNKGSNETEIFHSNTKENENVIPAVLKRESRNKDTGCPIKNFGHDGIEVFSYQTFVIRYISLFLAFSVIAFLTIGQKEFKYFKNISSFKGGQWVSNSFPEDAVSFILSNNIKGNMYNYFDWGGYLIWRFYPEKKVAVDGRNLYDFQYAQDNSILIAALEPKIMGTPYYKAILESFRVRYMLIPLFAGGGEMLPIVGEMIKDREWVPVFFKANSMVLVKDTPENQDVIRSHSIPMDVFVSYLFGMLNNSIWNSPGNFRLYLARGDLYYSLLRFKEAGEEYKKVIEFNPFNEAARYKLELIAGHKKGEK
ncbi:MAG: hypothetical protein HY754_00880 [Nitrospirae bacterium]|nr:hypothetical protein [Nitrospirota bacterium]